MAIQTNIKNYINMKIVFLSVTMVILSCSHIKPDKKHESLISFKSYPVMDMDELFEKPEKEYHILTDEINFNPATDTIKYQNNMIYISYLTYVNACAQYTGDIEIINDSIILKAKNIKDEECASGRLDRYVYQIRNIANKEYIIVKY